MIFFYTDNQSISELPDVSQSVHKPKKLITAVNTLGLPIEIKSYQPLSIAELSLAHDSDYVKQILNLETPNGFGNFSREVAQSLPWVNGSFTAATLTALNKNTIVCSPTSGFHHAHYNLASGFCTFNGLVIAAILAHQNGAKTVGILDCDVHRGNGTNHIIKTLGLDFITHYSYGYEDCADQLAQKWLKQLPQILSKFADCDVILYQAGADPFIDDPLGGVLTAAELLERDKIIFNWAVKMNKPLVWNLAGGYTKPISVVLNLHLNTIKVWALSLGLINDESEDWLKVGRPL